MNKTDNNIGIFCFFRFAACIQRQAPAVKLRQDIIVNWKLSGKIMLPVRRVMSTVSGIDLYLL